MTVFPIFDWLVLLDEMFFSNLSEILTVIFYLLEGDDKQSSVLQIEICLFVPHILNSLWAVGYLWTLTLLLMVSAIWSVYCELQPGLEGNRQTAYLPEGPVIICFIIPLCFSKEKKILF